jgi:anaerobic selenocysteine-containing dehydrogenase
MEKPDKYPLRFFTRHTRERINSQFNEIEALAKAAPVAKVQIHVSDAEVRKIKSGDKVRIFNDRGDITAVADVTPDIKDGNASMAFGRKKSDGASANILTEEGVSDFGYGATFHDCCVQIEKL